MSDADGETPEASGVTSVLHRLGGLGARHPWRVIGAWMLVVVAVGALSVTDGGEPTQAVGVPGSDSERAFDLLEERFPEQFGGRARCRITHPILDFRSGPAVIVADVELRVCLGRNDVCCCVRH